MSLTSLLVPTITQMLEAASAWLDKAIAHSGEDEAAAQKLLSIRLAPDMFPLAAQVRFACFQAQEAVHLLRGEPLPPLLESVRREALNANDQPGTMDQVRARIAETMALLSSVGEGSLDDGADRAIALLLPNGMAFDMTGDQYLRDWLLPQFYFHLNMAYAILRSHGVGLGKADLVPHMFLYLRAGTAPRA